MIVIIPTIMQISVWKIPTHQSL